MAFAPEMSRLPVARTRRETVLPMNLGLYLDRPLVAIPRGGLSGCRNVRCKEGRVVNGQMGYEAFMERQLNGRVILIDQFFLSAGTVILLFGTPTDLYRYSEITEDCVYITPTYETGTVSAISAYDSGNNETTITGSGTLWDTAASPTRPGGGGNNVKVGDEVSFGASENNPAATWYVVKAVTSDTEFDVTGDASAESTGAYTVRQLFDTGDQDVWQGETFPDAQPMNEDRWYCTNGEDLVTWDGSDPTVSAIDLGFSCVTLARHKNMMLYGNITESGQIKSGTIRNSAIANPENVSTLEASEFVATDGIDDLLQLVPIGDVMVSYHDRSVNLVQFVGSPIVWVVRTAIPGIGPISPRAIMDYGDFHEFVGVDTGYRFDGVGVEEQGGHVFREVLRQIDPSRRYQTLTHIDEENGDVLWVMPITTDENAFPEMAYVAHYLEEVGSRTPTPITIRDVPATETGFFERTGTLTFADLTEPWTSYNFKWNDRIFAANFPLNLFGDRNGNVFTMNTVEHKESRAVGVGSFTDEDIESWARTGRMPAIDGRARGLVKRVEPFMQQRAEATYDFAVQTHVADFLDGPIDSFQQDLFDLTLTGDRFVSPRLAARFLQIEFATTGQNRVWEASGFAVEIQAMGER